MTDSRCDQWRQDLSACRAVLDDIRTEMADMADEGVASNLLEAARCSTNVTLRYVDMLKTELGGDAA